MHLEEKIEIGSPAGELITLLDGALADEWGAEEHVVAFISGDGDERELGMKRFPGHPSETIPGLPGGAGWRAVGLSSLAKARHFDDPKSPPQRVRVTVAIDQAGEQSVVRFKEGGTMKLGPSEGLLGPILRGWFSRCS